MDWIGRVADKHNLEIYARDAVNLGDEMYDCLQDGVDSIEGVVAILHMAAVQAAEMRWRLSAIEDILGDEYDLDRLKEMVVHGRWLNFYGDFTGAECSKCGAIYDVVTNEKSSEEISESLRKNINSAQTAAQRWIWRMTDMNKLNRIRIFKPTEIVDVLLLRHKGTQEYSFVNLTKGHIYSCRFHSFEEAVADIEKRMKQGKILNYQILEREN